MGQADRFSAIINWTRKQFESFCAPTLVLVQRIVYKFCGSYLGFGLSRSVVSLIKRFTSKKKKAAKCENCNEEFSSTSNKNKHKKKCRKAK